MDAEVHRQVLIRCRGLCECGCGRKLPPGELDHFFGRAKAEETVENVWALSVQCHFEKTRNHPTASTWFLRFIKHCGKYSYAEAALRAEARLDYVDTRRMLGSALGARR